MTHKATNAPLLGVLLALASVALLSVMDAAIKVLIDSGMAVLQILALRSWLVVPLMAAWALRNGGLQSVKTGRVKLHLLRVGLGTGAPLFFFTSLKTMPLADATTIFFGSTFIMTALSAVLLKEPVGPHRWASVVVGFAGVVIAMRPAGLLSGEALTDMGALYAFGASVSYSCFVLVTRKLGTSEGALKQVLYFHIWLGVLGTASLPFTYRPFSAEEVAIVALVGMLVVGGHLSMTRAFSIAPVGLVAPFEYSALIWATGLGFMLWGDVPGPQVVVGATVIVASGLYLIYRETRTAKRAALVTEAVAAPLAVPIVHRVDTEAVDTEENRQEG